MSTGLRPRWTCAESRWPSPTSILLSPSESSPIQDNDTKRASMFRNSNSSQRSAKKPHLDSNYARTVSSHQPEKTSKTLSEKRSTTSKLGDRVGKGVASRALNPEKRLGKYIAKHAVQNDMVHVPRMPERAIVGISEDEFHSRDSYIETVTEHVDRARRHLPRGHQWVYDSEGFVVGTKPKEKPPTAIPQQGSSDEDAYMQLFDQPSPTAHRPCHEKATAVSGVPGPHNQVSEQKRTNKVSTGHTDSIERHPSTLRSGHRVKKDTSDLIPNALNLGKSQNPAPVYKPYRRPPTYQGTEAEKVKLPPGPKTHYYGEEQVGEAPSPEYLRSLVTKNVTPPSPSTEKELYPSESTTTIKRKRKSREHRTTVVLDMSRKWSGNNDVAQWNEHIAREKAKVEGQQENKVDGIIKSPLKPQEPVISQESVKSRESVKSQESTPTIKRKPLNPTARTFEAPVNPSQEQLNLSRCRKNYLEQEHEQDKQTSDSVSSLNPRARTFPYVTPAVAAIVRTLNAKATTFHPSEEPTLSEYPRDVKKASPSRLPIPVRISVQSPPKYPAATERFSSSDRPTYKGETDYGYERRSKRISRGPPGSRTRW
ncbi:hypothetical protein LTR51_000905 [Lithohypha guttulata]|nr:hypothetical protein LTR51_000905 [Lithohypha guttulata]